MNLGERLKRRCLETRDFFLPCLVCFVGVGLLLLFTERASLHLSLDRLKFPGGGSLFGLITHMGERPVAWFAGLAVLCQRRYRSGVSLLVAVIGAGLATEFLKYQVFGPVPRPVLYFGEPSPLHLVAGFKNHLDYSTPSGHAAIAFALFSALAFGTRSRALQCAAALLALLTAWSRVYLSEHFLEDVVMGAVLGVACAILADLVVRPPLEPAPGEAAAAGTVDEAIAGATPR